MSHHPFVVKSLSDETVEVIYGNKSMVMNISYKSFMYCLHLWEKGLLIQSAFSSLSDNEREFLLSGLTPEEFDNLFSEELLNNAGSLH